jgi:hypothetical protein
MKQRIEYQEISLEDIMRYFVEGFQPKGNDEQVLNYDWFLDAQKGKVIFRLFIGEVVKVDG